MASERVYIEGLASLAILAASKAIGRGEPIPSLPTVEQPKRHLQSDSLKRLLRKAKR